MQAVKAPAALLAALSAVLILLATACQSIPQSTQERNTTPMATAITTAIPPLDLAAPEYTETATFALG